MPVPQELLDKLNNAQALSEAATQKDQAATTLHDLADKAGAAAEQGTAEALAAHQASNSAAQDFFTAVRAHFGIT